jgi:hypothetical protein
MTLFWFKYLKYLNKSDGLKKLEKPNPVRDK